MLQPAPFSTKIYSAMAAAPCDSSTTAQTSALQFKKVHAQTGRRTSLKGMTCAWHMLFPAGSAWRRSGAAGCSLANRSPDGLPARGLAHVPCLLQKGARLAGVCRDRSNHKDVAGLYSIFIFNPILERDSAHRETSGTLYLLLGTKAMCLANTAK